MNPDISTVTPRPLISILIPTRNESGCIAALVEYLRRMPRASLAEIIVCDGQSEDATPEVARRAGARVLSCRANRGAQLNTAAQAAHGDLLWFLHADARPHRKSLEYFEFVHKRDWICGGNFRLRFDAPGIAPRSFEIIACLQRRSGIYYGDSGIWVRRLVFDFIGGFRDWPLFEDYDFARRLEDFAPRHGQRTEHSRLQLQASARRFQDAPLQVLLQWMRLQLQFSRGASPEQLAAEYFDWRQNQNSKKQN